MPPRLTNVSCNMEDADSEASTIVLDSSEEGTSPILLTQCTGCSNNLENQEAHYQGSDNPHGCLGDTPFSNSCTAGEWRGKRARRRSRGAPEGIRQGAPSEGVSETEESDDGDLSAPPCLSREASSTTSGKSVGSVCRMQHVYKRTRAQLLTAKQTERRAKIVWAAVKQWCEAEGVIEPDNRPVIDFEYDANVRAAADTLVAMGVPLRHLNVWERQSLQTEREDPILGMHY